MNPHCEDMAEGESATFSFLSLFITSITKFVIQIYPHLYPQMIRSIELSYRGFWSYLIVPNFSI